jgi:hypothetical protein
VETYATTLTPLLEAKRAALIAWKNSPNQSTKDRLTVAKGNLQRESRRCANEYWENLCSDIEKASNRGDATLYIIIASYRLLLVSGAFTYLHTNPEGNLRVSSNYRHVSGSCRPCVSQTRRSVQLPSHYECTRQSFPSGSLPLTRPNSSVLRQASGRKC